MSDMKKNEKEMFAVVSILPPNFLYLCGAR